MKEPRWICIKCGNKYGTPFKYQATFHIGECGICEDKKEVTSGRKYRPYKKKTNE